MTENLYETMAYRRAENGVAFISIDVPGRKVNVLTPELHRELGEIAEFLRADDRAVGAVIHSAKPAFLAGGDLNRIVQYHAAGRTAEEAYAQSRVYTESLRKLETCGKPVAVAINGTALGGGLELALAGHFRVVADDPGIKLGLPEVTLGLLPGGGGTQRLPRLIGLEKATSLILSGRAVDPAEALELGVVDKVAAPDELLAAAERWVLEGGVAEQPWDRRGFSIPGGAKLNDMNIGRLFQVSTARISAKYLHNYPAPIAALRCLFNGTTVNSMDAALRIETREFSALTRDPVARNIIRTLFINRRKRDWDKRREQQAGPVADLLGKIEAAYVEEGARMAGEGVSAALIENAALAAGMPEGPLALAGQAPEMPPVAESTGRVDRLKQRLLCIQALAAAGCWEAGQIEPEDADLASVLEWKFPSYTGGVISYIDTLGVKAFIGRCDDFAAHHGERYRPSDWLRRKGADSDRIY